MYKSTIKAWTRIFKKNYLISYIRTIKSLKSDFFLYDNLSNCPVSSQIWFSMLGWKRCWWQRDKKRERWADVIGSDMNTVIRLGSRQEVTLTETEVSPVSLVDMSSTQQNKLTWDKFQGMVAYKYVWVLVLSHFISYRFYGKYWTVWEYFLTLFILWRNNDF